MDKDSRLQRLLDLFTTNESGLTNAEEQLIELEMFVNVLDFEMSESTDVEHITKLSLKKQKILEKIEYLKGNNKRK